MKGFVVRRFCHLLMEQHFIFLAVVPSSALLFRVCSTDQQLQQQQGAVRNADFWALLQKLTQNAGVGVGHP